MPSENSASPYRRKNRLAVRAGIMYFGISALAVVIILMMGRAISMEIADEAAWHMARQHSIEAASNFQISTSQHFTLMQQISRSTTISRWLADESDPVVKGMAFEEIMGFARFSPDVYLMFTVYNTLQGYDFRADMTLEEFEPWGQLAGGEASHWFFSARDADVPFSLNVQRARPQNGEFELFVWSNHRMYYQGRFVGIVTVGSPFGRIFDAVFGTFNVNYKRGYLIDQNGIVRMDSAGLLEVFQNGLPVFPTIPEAAANPSLYSYIALHLTLMDDGIFQPGRHHYYAIGMNTGAFAYASISPIMGTNWSVLVLSNYMGSFGDARYMGLILGSLAVLLATSLAGSLLMRCIVLDPLFKLTQSAEEPINSAADTRLFGLARNDEIGDLARTVQRVQEMIKLREAERREIAEEESRAKTRFLARMSHEIRTPMNSVMGITEIQLRKGKQSPETEDAFLRIYSSSKLLLSIINDILDLAKVESGKMEITPTVYETANLIADVHRLNSIYIGGKKIDFSIVINENLPKRLIGDDLRIKQVLDNLVSNAFKYTKEGKVVLSFDMDKGEAEDEVVLVVKVSDSGRGMTKEQLNNLFDAEFTRFNMVSTRAIEGSGLGLSITYSLLKMTCGSIKAESELGKGSTFTAFIPQKKDDGQNLGKKAVEKLQCLKTSQVFLKKLPALAPAPEPEHKPKPYGRVLAVDDMESNLFVVEGILSLYDLTIETVLSASEAIRRIEAGQEYDIIFMDYMMPGMNGVEATKVLRGMGYNRPIVALTANATIGVEQMFMDNGFSGFISKPIDPAKLDACLLEFIHNKRLAADIAAVSGTTKEG